MVCLYFARRRAFLNVATGLGALLPVLAAQFAGFTWIDGLLAARADYVGPGRAATGRPCGGAGSASSSCCSPPARRWCAACAALRNTPGWPFLVGAGVAVAFSVLSGLARGGAEAAWLPFFPWLTVAAVAPHGRPGRRREPTAAGRRRRADRHRDRGRARHPVVGRPPTPIRPPALHGVTSPYPR